MNPFQRAAMNLTGGPCNAATQASPKASDYHAAPQTGPRVLLIPGDPARSHTLDSYTTCVDIGPGMSEETTHEVIHHYEATPERVQIDVSKQCAQLLEVLISNTCITSKHSCTQELLDLQARIAAIVPIRGLFKVIVNGVHLPVSDVFPRLG